MENIAQRLHHIAYITWDMANTAKFWTEVMNLELVAHVSLPKVPSTGEDYPYLHLFFKLADGSDLAFFEVRNVAQSHQEVGVGNAFKHIAFEVSSEAELEEYCRRLKAHQVNYIGPEEDNLNRYIYFFDPNEIKVQIALPYSKLTSQDAEAAHQVIAEWLARKSDAALPSGIASMVV